MGLRRLGFPGDGFWPAAERLTYFLLFPALLVNRLAQARLEEYAVGPVAVVVVVLLLGMTALAYTLRPWLGVDGPAFSSVYQGAIRFNTYVGLAVALAVFHVEGGTVAALVMALMIPMINVLCVLVLSAHAGGSISVTGVLRGLITNPLILACLVGIGLNLSGIGLPWGSAAMLDILARAALPLGLLAVGAGFATGGAEPAGLAGRGQRAETVGIAGAGGDAMLVGATGPVGNGGLDDLCRAAGIVHRFIFWHGNWVATRR